MIHTNRTVTVGNQESIIDSPIILYRGDREVEVEFTLNGNKFTFTNGGNVIKSANATHGQLVINTPSGENMFSEITDCHEGKVVFVITKEMIDELIEVGFYSFQIRLFDENQVSRVTIPPVFQGIDIRTPIAAEDETNVVDIGLVDYAIVQKDQYENLSTFLPSGDYNKTDWDSRDVISAAKLNKIEDALYTINNTMEASDTSLYNRVEGINQTLNTNIDNVNTNLNNQINTVNENLTNNINRLVIDMNTADATLQNEHTAINTKIDTNFNTLSNNKADKKDITDIQQQVNNLVLGAVGEGDNAEVVQARGTFDVLNDRLNYHETMHANTVPNLAENASITVFEGNATIVSIQGDTFTFRCPDSSTTSRFQIHVPMKFGKRYIFTWNWTSDIRASHYDLRILRGNWKGYPSSYGGVPTIIDVNNADMDGSTLVIAFKGAADTVGLDITIELFMYEDAYLNDYLVESCKHDYKNPMLNNRDVGEFNSTKPFNSVPAVFDSVETRGTTSGWRMITGVPTLRKDVEYMIVTYLLNFRADMSVRYASISSGSYSGEIPESSSNIRLNDSDIFYTCVIKPTVDTSNLWMSLPSGTATDELRVMIYELHNEFEKDWFMGTKNFVDSNIALFENTKVSSFKNDLNLEDLNRIVPFEENIIKHTYNSTSGYHISTDRVHLVPEEEYYVSVEVDATQTMSNMLLRTLSGGSWTNHLNKGLSRKTHNDIVYYEGFFSPSAEWSGGLHLSLSGVTANQEYTFHLRLYKVTDSNRELLAKTGGYREPIMDINLLANCDSSVLASDTFEPLNIQTTTRTANAASEWFSATATLQLRADRQYYVAINWRDQPIDFTSLYVRTITSGVWDNIVNSLMYPRYTSDGSYYECYFTPTEDTTGYLCLNYGGATVGSTYEFEVYVYEIQNELQEYALRMEKAFLSPSIKLANTADRHFAGKVVSALGDSLTATGSGGHYLQFTKNILGFSKVAQCGIGGTRVSGTGDTCFYQDTRINTLLIDSDFIIIKGGTNDAGALNFDNEHANMNIENHDVTTFVGAYNVMLSKIYYKYLKLDNGYYADQGIDYSGVTQVDVPKDIKIYLITPPKSLDGNILKRQNTAKLVREIGLMWGLPVVDANGEMQMNMFNYPTELADKVHYPLKFHNNLAKLIVGKMRETESF